MKILLVEDDVRIALPLKEELEYQGFCVDMAHDGMTGLTMGASGNYDFLLLDVMLPKLDGISVYIELRNRKCAAAIIMMSAKENHGPHNVGADAYLSKPFSLEALNAQIRALTPQECRASIA